MALATTISFLLTVLLATAFVSKADDYNHKDYYEQPSSVPRHFRRLSQELHPGFYKRELDPIYDHGQLPQESRRQTIQGSDMNKRFGITPDTSISQFLRIVANNILLLLNITSREIIKGANKVIANLNNHEDGGINVPAETTMGSAAGMMASQFFGQYFRERWTGIMSHVVQESVDRFVTGSIDFFNRSTSGNQRLNEEVRSEDYMEIPFSSSTKETDGSEDFDKFEINEYEDPVTKNYHCTLQNRIKNKTFTPDPEIVKYLDDNGILSIRPRRHNYQVRQIRRKLCQFGFDPFQPDNKAGSLHKRFKNTLRLMIYNTPGIFPGLKIIRNDLDRRRRREPQIWFRFEMNNGPLQVEFDYDNYFVTVSGDLSRIQAYSKMLVALKLHKRLNNFNDSISYKVNLDLGIMEVVLTSFGMWVMKDKSIGRLMENALNGIRTEVNSKGEVRLEFEQTLKDAADKIDPLLYSHVWLLSMAEKYEVVNVREGTQSDQDTSRNVSNDQGVTRSTREASFAVIDKINLLI